MSSNTPACSAYRQPFGAKEVTVSKEYTIILCLLIAIVASFYGGRNYERAWQRQQKAKPSGTLSLTGRKFDKRG